MKEEALSIYNAHLAIILHHFPDAPKYQQHTAAKKAAVREVEQIVNVAPIDKYENLQSELTPEEVGLHLFEEYWFGILTELHKL